MKKLFVTILVVFAAVSADSTAENFSTKFFSAIGNLEKASEGAPSFNTPLLQQEVSSRGWILNKEGKKALENLILTLPCGWPEYGIPPLAPYTNEELIINYNKNSIETSTKLIRFRVDGLDNLLINKLNIKYVFGKKVKYSITWPKIILSGKIDAKILLNLMPEYGINVHYDGDGNFELILENITFEGSFKYKVPFIFGSVKIYDFILGVSLENVVSNIEFDGTLNKVNELLNSKIEDYLWRYVKFNQNTISTYIEENVVDVINDKMKGHTIWYLIGMLGGSSKICYPPAIPWDVASDKEVL